MRLFLISVVWFSISIAHAAPMCTPDYYHPELEDFSQYQCLKEQDRGVASISQSAIKPSASSMNKEWIDLTPAQRRFAQILRDKTSKSLDIDGDGKKDLFRTFDDEGKISEIRMDENGEGKIDHIIHYDANGDIAFEKIDYNHDSKFDSIYTCSKDTCVRLSDTNFDGKPDSRITERKSGFVMTTTYERDEIGKGQFRIIQETKRSLLKIEAAAYDQIEGTFCTACYDAHDPAVLEKVFNQFDSLRTKIKLGEFKPKNEDFIETITGVLIHKSCIKEFGQEQMVHAVNEAVTTLGTCFAASEATIGETPKNAARYQHIPRLLRLMQPDKYSKRENTSVCMHKKTCATGEIENPFEKVDPTGISCSNKPCDLAKSNGCSAKSCKAFNSPDMDQPKIICQNVQNHDKYGESTLGFATDHKGQAFSVKEGDSLTYYAFPVMNLNLNAKKFLKDSTYLAGTIGHEMMHLMGYPHDHSIMPEYAIGCTGGCFPGLSTKIAGMADKTDIAMRECMRPMDEPHNVNPNTQTAADKTDIDHLMLLKSYTLGEFRKF